MAPKIDKCEEGLRALASMIAADYRRRTASEILSPLNTTESNVGNGISEVEIVVRMEPTDSPPGFVYTETVGVRNFIRNKVRQDMRKEINVRDSEGGQDVADKGNTQGNKG